MLMNIKKVICNQKVSSNLDKSMKKLQGKNKNQEVSNNSQQSS